MNNIISRDVWKKLNNPVIITKEEWNLNKDEVLFKNQLKQMLALTEDSSENNDIFEKNNVVAVVGERGSGKTSVLKSYKNIVESDKNYVFDIINPDLFDSEISILITYVTELYKVLEKDSFKFSKDHLYPKTVNGLLEIIKLLSDIQKKTKYFDIEHPSVDILDDIDNRLKFTSRLKELTNDVLQIMNLEGKSYKKFILIIDDIDLSESHIVFKLFDEIQKYLSPSIDIILSFRESQLHEAIIQHLILSQKELLDRKIIDIEEIRRQASRMINKIIPANNIVRLFSKEEILKRSLSEVNNIFKKYKIKWNLGSENKEISESIYHEVFLRTNLDIRPIDKKEDVGLFLPNNLRGIVQLIEIIENQMIIAHNKYSLPEIYRHNLNIFKNYILSVVKEEFEYNDVNFINVWLLAPNELKAYRLYDHFYTLLSSKRNDNDNLSLGGLINSKTIEPFNITLGDVIHVFENYKLFGASSFYDYNLIYVIKVLYSIELSLEAINMIESKTTKNNKEKFDFKIDTYQKLINRLVFPRNYNFYDNSNLTHTPFINWGKLEELTKQFEKAQLKETALNNFVYTPYSMKSRVSQNIESENIRYRFRRNIINSQKDFYELNPKGLRITNNFLIHPFAFLGDKKYITSSLNHQIKNKSLKDRSQLIVTNLFSIDYLLRKTYSRTSTNNPVEYVIKSLLREGGLFREFFKEKDNINDLSPHYVKYFTDDIHFMSNIDTRLNSDINIRTYYPIFNENEITLLSDALYLKDIDEENKLNKDNIIRYIDKMKIKNVSKNEFQKIAKLISDVRRVDELEEAINRISGKNKRVRESERLLLLEELKAMFNELETKNKKISRAYQEILEKNE